MIVSFTLSMVDAMLDSERLDFDRAEELLADATQELLALQQESEEYSALGTSIESLQAMMKKVQQRRAEAETPADVT